MHNNSDTSAIQRTLLFYMKPVYFSFILVVLTGIDFWCMCMYNFNFIIILVFIFSLKREIHLFEQFDPYLKEE